VDKVSGDRRSAVAAADLLGLRGKAGQPAGNYVDVAVRGGGDGGDGGEAGGGGAGDASGFGERR